MMAALQDRMADYIASFTRDGVLILPGAFTAAALAPVQAAIDGVKHARPLDVVIDDLESGERSVLGLDRPPQALPPSVAARLPVAEWSYLRRYPDVAAAVARGQYAGGAAH